MSSVGEPTGKITSYTYDLAGNKKGDEVYAQNIYTGEKGLKAVKNVFENGSSTLIHVTVGEETIKATPEHPFYVDGEGWVKAKSLTLGDKVRLYSGENKTITSIKKEELENKIKVYNFEVEDFHTYFVSEENILVHNDCSGSTPFVKGTAKTSRTEIQRTKWKEYTGNDSVGEVHHGLLEQYHDWFKEHGIEDINSGEYYFDLDKGTHRLKANNGIHTNNSPLDDNWNSIWKKWTKQNPETGL